MNNRLTYGVATVFLCCVSPTGRADQAAAAASPPAAVKPEASPAPVVQEVVVTGERPAVEKKIDRTIYNLSRELQATAGSAADVLRNLPSVTVDLEGNPSLRGDDGVQILIDGREAPQFNGPNRGAALQQLGAENIDRIEVITNPPANFKRDGSAGIINIVTKRRAGARTATVQASVGSRGRYNLSTSQGAQIGKLNLRGTAGVRRDLRIRDIDGRRRVRDPATGTVLAERQLAAAAEDERLSTSASLGADYDLTTVDRLGAEADFSRRDADFEIVEQNLVLGTNGAVNNQFERSRISREHERNSSVLLRYHHAGENDGDGLTVTAQSSEYFEHTPPHLTNRYVVPPQAPTIQRQVFDEYELLQEFSVEYLSSLSGDGKFISGYDVERTQDHFDYSQTIPVDIGEIGPPDPDFTNQLRFEQTIHALYGSYEHPLGHWTALAGLRLEQTDLLVRQVTSAERSSQDYFRVFPTLHLSDKLDDQQTLSFSYGKRLVRPFAQDLDPNRLEPDAFTIRQGNPRLEPIEIDSLEAGWSYDEGHTSLSTTLYARRRRNDLAYLSTPISPTVVLITPANVGESTSGGVELAASGRVIPQLDFKLSGNLFYNQIDAGNLGFAGKRSTFAYQAKAAVNWRATPRDTLQINLGSTGKRLTPQGYARGSTAVDLGFRHQFRPDFSITATVSDVFAKRRFETNLATPALSETTRVRFPGRVAYLGVTWSLPDAKQNPQENFDYGE